MLNQKATLLDLGTRGIAPSDLMNSSLWWKGPQFLRSLTYEESFEDNTNLVLPPEKTLNKILRNKVRTQLFKLF